MWVVADFNLVILKTLYHVFPNTFFNVVQISKNDISKLINKNNMKRTKIYISDDDIKHSSYILPPYPSIKTHDAKLWVFVLKYSKNGDYVWNSGKDCDIIDSATKLKLQKKFPLYKTRNKLDYDYKLLRNYKPKFISYESAKKLYKHLPDFDFDKLGDKYIISYHNHINEKYINYIADYFSEECRILCKKWNKNLTPMQYFVKNYYKLINDLKPNEKLRSLLIDQLMWGKYLCQLFMITSIVSLYYYFKPKNILDFSAGWGDRLISAISLDIKYTGVDPSNCMKPVYDNIIEKLATNKNNYKIYNIPFQDTNFDKEQFDFIFSSPPFFKLEIYESSVTQSTFSYSDLNDWINNFLYVLIYKCNKYLEKNGHFCIHISDYGKFSYVDKMMSYIKNNT